MGLELLPVFPGLCLEDADGSQAPSLTRMTDAPLLDHRSIVSGSFLNGRPFLIKATDRSAPTSVFFYVPVFSRSCFSVSSTLWEDKELFSLFQFSHQDLVDSGLWPQQF